MPDLLLVPLTFPAHQVPVLPLKLWRPHAVDGTALCIGAAAPDLAYPLGDWWGRQSHTAIGLLVWAVPFTLVYGALLRWRGAAGFFSQLPDAGPFRLRSYAVLAARRPAPLLTLASAGVGAASHVVLDAFTHAHRWGAQWVGFDHVVTELDGHNVTVARMLQYAGHVGGSALGLVLFAHIGRRRLLERWYGDGPVAAARATRTPTARRLVFWPVVAGPPLVVAATGRGVFSVLLTAAISILAGGVLVPPMSPDPGRGRTGDAEEERWRTSP